MEVYRLAQPKIAIWFNTVAEYKKRERLGDTLYHHLKVGYACYMRNHRDDEWTNEDWLRFTTRAEFWQWVNTKVQPKSRLYLFCHNTSFDLPVLDIFHEVPKLGFRLRGAIIEAPPTILKFRRGTSTIVVLDTLNIWRMPLAQLGKEIGNVKYEMPDDNELGIDWDTYGRKDVEIIRDSCISWFRFLRSNEYGSFAPTLASQSMRVYRHRYMRHRIYLDDNPKALALTRDGYYGGRNECFKIGRYQGQYTLLDVNSMYPSVMANNPFPYRLLSHTYHASVADLTIWLRNYAVSARVLLRTVSPFAPIRENHKLVFPIGEFEAILSTPELKYATEHAEVLEVREVAVYEQAMLFTEMMNDLYYRRVKAKENGRPVEAFMYRKIMNSFYGKWGQRGEVWEDMMNIDDLEGQNWMEYDYEEKTMRYYRKLGGLVQRRGEDVEAKDSFVAIAGHITAYARMVLWEIISQADLRHVLYCDTDSVLIDSLGRRNLQFRIGDSQFGLLSVKGEYDEVEIFGCKDYRFGDKKRTKGVRKDADWKNPHLVHQTKWSGLRGLIAAGIVDRPITQRVRKHLSRLYDKGEILADGTCQPRLILPE